MYQLSKDKKSFDWVEDESGFEFKSRETKRVDLNLEGRDFYYKGKTYGRLTRFEKEDGTTYICYLGFTRGRDFKNFILTSNPEEVNYIWNFLDSLGWEVI